MAAISREEVAHLARLSRLAVTDEELDMFAGQLDVILQAVARVGEVAAADIPPTSHSVPLTNVLREDVEVPCLPQPAVLAVAIAQHQVTVATRDDQRNQRERRIDFGLADFENIVAVRKVLRRGKLPNGLDFLGGQ